MEIIMSVTKETTKIVILVRFSANLFLSAAMS